MTKKAPIMVKAHQITTTKELKPLQGMTLTSAIWYPETEQIGLSFRKGDEAQGIMIYLKHGKVGLSDRITIPEESRKTWGAKGEKEQ